MKMNRFTLCLTLLLGLWAALGAQAQVKIGNNPTTISAGSLLELEHKPGSPKSFVPPRMTTAERTAIPTPLVGSMVYNTDKPNSTSANLGCWESYDLTDKDGDGSRWNCIGVTSTSATSGTANSGGYINSCGCTYVATINAPAGVFANGDTEGDTDTDSSAVKTALADPLVCDIAVNLNATIALSANSYYDLRLPKPGPYAGRIFTVHFALPLQVSSGSIGAIFIDVHPPLGGLYVAPNDNGGESYFTVTSGGSVANNETYQGKAGYAVPNFNIPFRMGPTVKVASDGIRWYLTILSSDCIVIRP